MTEIIILNVRMKTKMTKLYNRITEVLEKFNSIFQQFVRYAFKHNKTHHFILSLDQEAELGYVYHVELHSLFCLDLHLPDEGYSKNDCEQIFKQFLLAQLICFLFNFICQDCSFQLQRTIQNCKFNCKTYMTSFSYSCKK